MKFDLVEWIAGRPVIGFGAGEYYQRAMEFGELKIDYFIDEQLAGEEKSGSPIHGIQALQDEERDVAIIIFSRAVGDALLELRQLGYEWRRQVMDCRCFGVMNRYPDDYVYLKDVDAVCQSEYFDVSLGLGAEVEMQQIMVPVSRAARPIQIRVGNGGRLRLADGLVEPGCQINVGGQGLVELGSGFTLGENSILSAASSSEVVFGERLLMSHDSIVDAANHVGIRVGTGCTFGWHLHLYAYAPIEISDDMMASSYVYIESGAGHDLIIDGQKRYPESMTIGKHVWVGLNSTILAGSHIGDGCMIGASSLVNRKFGERQLIAGNPARVIKEDIVWNRDYTAYKEVYHRHKEN